MRLLHLIDGAAAGGPGRDEGLTASACAAVVRHAPGEHQVVVIGGSGLRRGLRAAGLGECAWVPAPLGKSLLATRGVRRMVLDRAPDMVVAWSLTALAAARRAEPEVRRVAVLADGGGLVRPGVRALAGCACGVVGRSLRDELVAAGASAARIEVLSLPGGGGRSRDEARGALGLVPGEVAVAHLGSGVYAGAMRFVFTMALLAEAGCVLTALVREGTPDLSRALSFHSGSARRFRLLVVGADAVPAADLAVYEGGGHGPMHSRGERAAAATPHVARTLALGIPVVAPAWAGADLELPAELRERCLGLNAMPTELARVALPLLGDERVRARMGALALGWSARRCDDAAFARAVGALSS